ncbi:MAG TPA: Hsp20/alpha crystallin family protein [Planctomycetota bacterium]|nr:Hsp20/alpha crystallin family protein [Planctomycetota bacterium]
MNRLFPSTWLRPASTPADLDRWIHDFWRSGASSPVASIGAPSVGAVIPVNVHETGDAFEVDLELPGMTLEDVEVVLEGRELTVRGERKLTLPEGTVWQRRERFHGKFARVLRLPTDVDSARVNATLRNGVLTIRCPKSEASKPRRIQIETSSATAQSARSAS